MRIRSLIAGLLVLSNVLIPVYVYATSLPVKGALVGYGAGIAGGHSLGAVVVKTSLAQNDWMIKWRQKLEQVGGEYDDASIIEKRVGRFMVRQVPRRDMAKRPRITSFRDVPDQNIVDVEVNGRHYILGINRFPAFSGHGLIYEDYEKGPVSPQVMREHQLLDLLAIHENIPLD